MKIVYFTHSLSSCWNHGNAHFLRGVLRELVRRGHAVRPSSRRALEPRRICADQGEAGLDAYRERLSRSLSTTFGPRHRPRRGA